MQKEISLLVYGNNILERLHTADYCMTDQAIQFFCADNAVSDQTALKETHFLNAFRVLQ